MKFLPLFVAFFTMASSYSAQSTSVYKSTLAKLKESPLSLTYGLTGDTVRDDESKSIDGMNLWHDFLIGYNLTAKDQIKVTPEFSNEYGASSAYALTELRYQRSGVLTEEENGVNVTFQQRYVYNNNRASAYGTSSTRLYIDRTFADGPTLRNIIRYDVTHDDSATAMGNARLRLYTTPLWTFSDKLSAGLTFRYQHTTSTGDAKKADTLTLIPNASYGLAANQSLGLATYVTAMESGDGSIFAKNVADGVTYELSYTLSVF